MKKHSKKTTGIKCDLYSVSNSNGKIVYNKLHDAKIIGKNLFISQLQENLTSSDESFFNEYSFNYSYNIPFNKKIPGKGKKEQKLNTKITYEGSTGDKPFIQICYTHLTCRHKIINSLRFKRLWMQQPSSIMWIINILVAILAILATLSIYFK